MKKLFFFTLAAALLAGCSYDETVDMAESHAVSFSNAFVNNGTRSVMDPSLTKTTLKDFAVYGFTENGQIFDGTVVETKDQGVTWTYSPLQYWVAGNTYTFSAIAPASTTVVNEALVDNKVNMTVSFTGDGKTDLLHAAPAPIKVDKVFAANPTPIRFTFNHQLAKVKFSFANQVGEGYQVKVSAVKIIDAKQAGTLTVGETNVWPVGRTEQHTDCRPVLSEMRPYGLDEVQQLSACLPVCAEHESRTAYRQGSQDAGQYQA